MTAVVGGEADGVGDMVHFGADMDWPGSGQTRSWFCSYVYDGDFLPHRRCAVQPLDGEYGDGVDADWVWSAAYRRHDLDHEDGADAVGG